MKKQDLESVVLKKFLNTVHTTPGSVGTKIKSGKQIVWDTIKDYLSTSEYKITQYKNKNKIAVNNKAYYQKTLDINKKISGFKSAGISANNGIEGKLSIDAPKGLTHDFYIVLDENPKNPKKYIFNKVTYSGIFKFTYP